MPKVVNTCMNTYTGGYISKLSKVHVAHPCISLNYCNNPTFICNQEIFVRTSSEQIILLRTCLCQMGVISKPVWIKQAARTSLSPVNHK